MVVDIIIKSFNRPYYLERCIRSIYRFVEGEYRIKVLDDGTAPEYLDKIAELFPEVQIYKSPLYEEKWKALKEHISGGKQFDLIEIPTNFWIESVSHASDIFLLIEDDIWLTGCLHLHTIMQEMNTKRIEMLKIYWQGNANLNHGKISSLSPFIEEIKPRIPLLSEVVLNNKYKLASILFRLKLLKYDIKYLLPFYSVYTVASVFFKKEYWLELWKGASEKVDESYQLRKAFVLYKKRNSRFAKMKMEVAKTSYITSTANRYPDISFDMNHFNYVLNECWVKGGFDVMQNFPNDFALEYIASILKKSNNKVCSYKSWYEWVKRFKGQYAKIGCEVD